MKTNSMGLAKGIFAICLTAFCAQTAMATQEQPSTCPSVEALVAGKINYVTRIPGNAGWLGQQESDYGTDQTWSLYTIFPIATKSGTEALAQSIEALSLLHYQTGPDPRNEGVYCFYSDDTQTYNAVTVNFKLDPASAMSLLRK